jgi:type II secretory pathway pseudopilin PulG
LINPNKQRINSRHHRLASGFTVVERFVLVLIIALLVGVALPYFFNAQDAQTEATVKANMKIAQMAADSFARDNDGVYPPSASDPGYGSYFPGGNRNIKSPTAGSYPINPFTNAAQAPMPGNVSDVAKTRTTAPARLGQAGAVYYNPIAVKEGDDDEPANKSYAIQGAGKTGYALIDIEVGNGSHRTTMVLSKGH